MLAFAASGSGAMESAVTNLVRPGDTVLVCAAGKFGERWIELCEAYGAELVRYEPGWGERLDPAEIDRLLAENPGIEVAFATLSARPRPASCTTCRRSPRSPAATASILAVDAVSGLGAAELRQDDWGVDVVVAGSQKALMCPPGLAFASVSERALEYADVPAGGRYYFDWGKTAKSQRKGASPFTPAVSLFLGLDVALGMIEEEGLDDVLARHQLLARATRAGAAAIGLELFGDPDERSTVVTAVELPDDVDGGKVPGALRKLGITANGGQDHLKGRILRIAHCGYFGAFDIVTSLSGLEMVLPSSATRSSTAPASAPPSACSWRPASRDRVRARADGACASSSPSDRRHGRRDAARAVRRRRRRSAGAPTSWPSGSAPTTAS